MQPDETRSPCPSPQPSPQAGRGSPSKNASKLFTSTSPEGPRRGRFVLHGRVGTPFDGSCFSVVLSLLASRGHIEPAHLAGRTRALMKGDMNE